MFPKGNRYSVGNNGGRPRMYDEPGKLKKACDDYFLYIQGEVRKVIRPVYNEDELCYEDKEVEEWVRYPEPATITGLCLFLGFSDRTSLKDYEDRKEFSHIIKRARLLVENSYERRLMSDKPTGPIFALKNMGWKDKIETGFTDKEGNDIQPFIALPTDKLRQIENLLSNDETAPDNAPDTSGNS